MRGNLLGQIGRGTTGTPGHITKKRIDGFLHALHASVQILDADIGARREKFNGNKRLAAGLLLGDQVDDLLVGFTAAHVGCGIGTTSRMVWIWHSHVNEDNGRRRCDDGLSARGFRVQ